MKRTILAAIVAAAAFAPSAQAQVMNPIKFGISGGVSIPTSDITEDFEELSAKSKLGYNIGGHVGFQVPLFPVGLRADIGYNSFDGEEFSLTDGPSSFRSQTDVNLLSGTMNVLLSPAGMLVAKPYLIGGIGAYRVETKVETEGSFAFPDEPQTFTERARETKTDFGVNGGAGVRFGLAGFSTFIEARYHYVFNEQSCDGGAGAESCTARKATTFVPVSFGIMF